MRLPLLALLLSGCALSPDDQREACSLLDIAQSEARMAAAWHSQAGRVLDTCGIPKSIWKAQMKACYAEAFDGWRKHEECDAILWSKP